MTRMTFFALAAVAMIGTACERHSASEMLGEHGGPEGHVPGAMPQNPGGSGPANLEEKHGVTTGQPMEQKEAAPAALATPSPKGSSFFPTNK